MLGHPVRNRLFTRLVHGIANGFAFEPTLRSGLGDGGGFYGQRGLQGAAQALALGVGRFCKAQSPPGIALAGQQSFFKTRDKTRKVFKIAAVFFIGFVVKMAWLH